MITPDGRRLIATRGLRGYADGLIAASLAGYLGDSWDTARRASA